MSTLNPGMALHLLNPRPLNQDHTYADSPSEQPRPRHLPGDTRPDIAGIIRVDQAGEYGAKRIYAGQLAVLGKGPQGPIIRHMAEQEQVHLDLFNRTMADLQVRPTLLQPLWHVAGWALGAGTALLGARAAMACTVAVEEVIDQHYAEQAHTLPETETALRDHIEQFRAEEIEHRDIGLAHGAEQTPGYPVLSTLIKAGSRAAIWLSQRL